MKKALLFVTILVTHSLFAQMPNTISKADKIYGLSMFWQEVNYNFSFLYKVDREAWNAEYKKLITEVQHTQNDYEYYRLLEKFCALLEDGHTNIYYPKAIKSQILYDEFGDYRIELRNIEDKAIVTRMNKSKQDEIPIGSELIEINNMKCWDYINAHVRPYYSSSTMHISDDYCVARIFKAPKGTSYDVVFKSPEGKHIKMKLQLQKCNEALYPEKEARKGTELKWMEDGIAYLGLHSFDRDDKGDSLFVDILPELYGAKKMIIDLRYNSGGSTGVGFDILQYLTHDDYLYGLKLTSRLHSPAYKAWGTWTHVNDTMGNPEATKEYLSHHDQFFEEIPIQLGEVKIDAKRIVVPTVILIGNFTASAAEDFLLFADNQEHMITMGEPTYGSTGQPLFFRLPGGGSARVCTMKNTYTDGREFVGIGIIPEIEAKTSYQDFLNDRDPVMEKAIEYLKN